jgi:hypothetical protein
MRKHSELADELYRYSYQGSPDNEVAALVAVMRGAADALRELEAENERWKVRWDDAIRTAQKLEAERDRLRELVERTVAHADRMHLILPPEMVREFRAALEGE